MAERTYVTEESRVLEGTGLDSFSVPQMCYLEIQLNNNALCKITDIKCPSKMKAVTQMFRCQMSSRVKYIQSKI